jgi:hypothetical protein
LGETNLPGSTRHFHALKEAVAAGVEIKIRNAEFEVAYISDSKNS